MKEVTKAVIVQLEELMASMTQAELIAFMDDLFFFLKINRPSSLRPALLITP